jgi:hypothetical protein
MGPEKSEEGRCLALEYELRNAKNFRDAWNKPVQTAWHLCHLFENLEKLIFIAHGAYNGSDQIKSRKLHIVPWREYENERGPDDMFWACTADIDGENFAEAAGHLVRVSMAAQLRRQRENGIKWNPAKPPPTIDFKELVGV